MVDIKQLIGNRIRDLRKERGISQEVLGEKADLHYTYVGAVERGEKNCSIETLDKIAHGLNVPINALFNFPSSPEDLKRHRTSITQGIGKCSPEAVWVLARLIDILGSQHTAKKPKKNRQKV